MARSTMHVRADEHMSVTLPARRADSICGVVFDMDGVIVDSHPAHRKAWRQFLQTVGLDVSDRELDFILDGRKRHDILRHFLGHVSESELLEYGKRKDDFFRQSACEVRLIPGVNEFLIHLRRNQAVAAVATSASEARTQSTLQSLHLAEYFSVILTGNDVANGKPDPAIYRLACQRLNIPPQNLLAVEDAVSGIKAANAAGLGCLGICGPEDAQKLQSAGARHVIESFVGLSLTKLKTMFSKSHSHVSPPA